MATLPLPQSPPPLDSILGASLIGLIVSSVIYGISVLQTYLYFTRYSLKDKSFLKGFVATLLLLDTTHLVLIVTYTYHYTVKYFGRLDILSRATWTLMANIPAGALLTLCVQWFFAYRVHQLSAGGFIIPVIICALSLCQLGFGIAYMVNGINLLFAATADKNLRWTTSALACDIACDLLITSSMVSYLLRCRTGFTRTNRTVNLLITYLVNSCFLITVCTVTCLGLFIRFPNDMYHAAFYFIGVRLYSCTFLSTLNSREGLQKELGNVTTNDGILTLSNFAAGVNSTAVGSEGKSSEGKSSATRTHGFPVETDIETAGKAV